jgi:hypothetical protein
MEENKNLTWILKIHLPIQQKFTEYCVSFGVPIMDRNQNGPNLRKCII